MRALEEGRRQEQLLEVNSLVLSAPDPLVTRTRILEFIMEEFRRGLDEEGERHVTTLCVLMLSAEKQRLEAKTEQELADMLDLYHRIRRELREASDARLAAGILARSVVPVLADVCLVDLAEGRGVLRRAAVETSHLVPDARPIKTALATPPDDGRAPHDPQLVARTGTTRHLPEVSDEDLVCASSTPEHLHALRALNPTGYLCVPLESEDSTVGAMTFLRVRPGHTFTDPQKRLAEALGEIYGDAATGLRLEARPDPSSSARSARDRTGANDSHAHPAGLAGYDLTPRELEILKLMNRGHSRESVAKSLSISVKTCDNHTASFRAKLNAAPNNFAALAVARAAGLEH